MSVVAELRELSEVDKREPVTAGPPALLPSGLSWGIDGDQLKPIGGSIPRLNAGSYIVHRSMMGPFLTPDSAPHDQILQLPEESHQRVLDDLNIFLRNRPLYQKHGLVYKRGYLLSGQPGCGKTILVQRLIQEAERSLQAITLCCDEVCDIVAGIDTIRRVEPSRFVVVVIEDIDYWCQSGDEIALLSLMDGEHGFENVVYLATTNNLEAVPLRISNRPSRIDRHFHIAAPSAASRRFYLGNFMDEVPEKWLVSSEGMSFAHLKEMVVAIHCLGQPFDEVVARLQSLPKE